MTPAQFARIARCSEEAARERIERHDSKVRGDGKMITLDEYNERMCTIRGAMPVSEWACCDVACPDCGKELLEQLGISLASNPPQVNVKCGCGYRGYKIR